MENILKFFYDLETTGLSYKKNSVHHLFGYLEQDGKIVDQIDLKIKPHPKAIIEAKALEVGGVTEETILKYPTILDSVNELKKFLELYVDRFDSKDKIYLVGYNNKKFDDFFLQTLFSLAGDDMSYLCYFWSHSIDVMCLASEALQHRRRKMGNFKLKTVAKELGIVIDESRLHTADYDVELTRNIYNIVTGRQIEL